MRRRPVQVWGKCFWQGEVGGEEMITRALKASWNWRGKQEQQMRGRPPLGVGWSRGVLGFGSRAWGC